MNADSQKPPKRGQLIPSLVKQPLFDHMIDEHDVIMIDSEMDEVCRIVKNLESCEWEYDNLHEKWDSDCGNGFIFESGGPTENGFKNCPYCGKTIK